MPKSLNPLLFSGKPLPSVVWLRNSAVIDETYVTELHDTTIIRNELQLSKLERDDLLMEFTCRTTNSNISKKASVKLDLNREFSIFYLTFS
jgi:translation initiation factor 2 beta subunit (eIF-2beta)/eIF-5